MVTVLPKETFWSDLGESAVNAGVKGYEDRSDEKALQKSIMDLGPNPPADKLLQAVLGTRTNNPKTKQTFFENALGVEKFKEAQKQSIAKRELDELKKTLETTKSQQKLDTDKNNALLLVDNSDLSDDEKQALREKVKNGEASFNGIKEVTKPKKVTAKEPTSEFEKGISKENVKIYSEAQKDLVEADRSLKDLERVDALGEKLAGPLGYVKALNPFNEDAAELNALGFGVIKPVVKIFNPSGPIAEKKLKQLQEKYGISATDSSATIKGKTSALRGYAQEAKKIAELKIRLISEHKGNPPLGELAKVDAAGQSLLDHMSEASIPGEEVKTPKGGPQPAALKGKTVKFPDGKLYYSDGETWRAK